MSNRWFISNFIQCGRCQSTQRMATGYKPIPNPILFNTDDHCREWFVGLRQSTGHNGLSITQRCETCKGVHSKWSVLNHQKYLDMKTKPRSISETQ